MRDPERIDRIVELLRTKWKKDPDARLCQILGNMFPGKFDLYHVEDDLVEKKLKDDSEVT